METVTQAGHEIRVEGGETRLAECIFERVGIVGSRWFR
jgi:hypothetical protein